MLIKQIIVAYKHHEHTCPFTAMATVASFHEGGPLNLWERCCLRSFGDHGHVVRLYSYSAIDLPEGVVAADAAAIVPAADFQAFISRSPGAYAQFSDLFRYELLFRHGGWWIDTDVLCLSSTLPDSHFFIARKKGERVNNAILAFSPGHEFVADALTFARKAARKTRSSRRVFLGPDLVSRLVKERGLLDATASQDVCYPFHQQHVFDFVMPERRARVVETLAKSPFVHLFQENFRHVGFPRNVLPPAGSYLAEKFVQHGAVGASFLDLEQCRAFEQVELRRRQALRDRPTGWRRKWHNSVNALASLGRMVSLRGSRERVNR